jgi:CBS domain-containing protein
VVALPAERPLDDVRAFLASGEPGSSHQGFPVVSEAGHVMGVLTRRDLLNPAADASAPVQRLLRRPPVVVYDDVTLREAADHMVRHDVGRLPVISREESGKLVGIITRSDLLSAHRRRLRQKHDAAAPTVTLPFLHRR